MRAVGVVHLRLVSLLQLGGEEEGGDAEELVLLQRDRLCVGESVRVLDSQVQSGRQQLHVVLKHILTSCRPHKTGSKLTASDGQISRVEATKGFPFTLRLKVLGLS